MLSREPYVEFYDKNNQPSGRAYVMWEILSGGRKVAYTNNEGNTIPTRHVDEGRVLNNAVNTEASNALDKDTGTSGVFHITKPVILCYPTSCFPRSSDVAVTTCITIRCTMTVPLNAVSFGNMKLLEVPLPIGN